MSDNKTETKKTGNSPSYIAYQVSDRDQQKGFWTRIGVAFAHADGKGFTIQVAAVPLDGRVTLRLPSEKKE
jgi:hypothetical protein